MRNRILTIDFANFESRLLALQIAEISKGRVELLNVDQTIPIALPEPKLPQLPVIQRPTNRHERRRQAKLRQK